MDENESLSVEVWDMGCFASKYSDARLRKVKDCSDDCRKPAGCSGTSQGNRFEGVICARLTDIIIVSERASLMEHIS